MVRLKDNRDKMLEQLQTFHQKHGHCNVPTNGADDPQLGRWVAAQRYKRKIGALPDELVKELDALGFVWAPSDEAWKAMLRDLAAFKKEHGHTNVPEQWPENRKLANWVQSQRHRKRKGKLPTDRVHALDGIGFSWAIYKNEDVKLVPVSQEPPPPEHVDIPQERLYVIKNGTYVQYSGTGAMPRELTQYIKTHDGEFPPYMPLPSSETTFYLGERFVCEKRIRWAGKGKLPAVVLRYVEDNGTLPRHD